jgi:hypothetical protein
MAAYTVAELSPKPISVPAYGGATSYTKTVAFIVVSEDVLRQPFAAERLEVELRRAISGGTNGAFLELLAALADTQTASGSTAAAVATDLAVALATLGTSASSRLYLAVSPSTLSELALRTDTAGSLAFPNLGATGGEIGGIEVLASDSLETSPPSAILFDSTKLVLGDSGIRLQASRHGSVEMSNTPGGSAAYSLWQRNATGIRAERSLQLGAAQPDTSGGHFAAVVIQNAW